MLVELFLFSAIFGIWWFLEDRRKHKGLPPGPTRYPLIGTLPSFIGTSLKPNVILNNLAKKYGDVVFLSVGKFEAIVFSSYPTLTEILGHENAGDRDVLQIPMINERQKGKNVGIVFGCGKPVAILRQFTNRTLRGFGKSHTMEFVIQEEVEKFTKHIDKIVEGSPDRTILCHRTFDLSATNVFWRLITAEKYELNDPRMMKLTNVSRVISSGSSFVTDLSIWFPVLRNVFPSWFAKSELRGALRESERFAMETIKARRESGTYSTDPVCFLDCLLQKVDEERSNPDTTFTDEQLLYTVIDMFQGSTDTFGNTLTFMVLYMLLNPDVQKKVQQEIDSVIPEKSPVLLSYKSQLSYVHATILESHRIISLVPYVPRTASSDFTFHGHRIKRGTYLLANIQSHHHSKEVWQDPSSFRPERFLRPDGKVDSKRADMVLAFGAGRRICIGKSYADAALFLYFTTILRNYSFFRAEGKPEPTYEPTGACLEHPKPFYVRIVKR